MLKNRPLFIQIWLVFGLAMALSMFFMGAVPTMLRSFFDPVIHNALEKAQMTILESELNGGKVLPEIAFTEQSNYRRSFPIVEHFLLNDDGTIVSSALLPPGLLDQVVKDAHAQREEVKHYEFQSDTVKIHYVLRRLDNSSGAVYLISYLADFYRDEMVQGLFFQFMYVVGIMLLICWVPSIFLAKYLSKPLVQLEQRVKQIADRDWHRPIKVDRRDEIGKLASSIERMREKLLLQDDAQQSFLQNISHELKTPVMVIRSFVQSIYDGVYPRGDLESTVKVIDEEAQRLEKRIQNLLYLSKIDYLSTHEPTEAKADLKEILEKVVSRFSWRRGEIQWSVNLVPLTVPGTPEQWTVAIENILDNQLRYAVSRVHVLLLSQERENGAFVALVRIWNDGPPISDPDLGRLFQKFERGSGGEFGLGLSIAQRIVSLFGGKIWAVNEHEGVAFYLEVPGCSPSRGIDC